MVKENPDNVPVTVFATHTDLTSPVLQAADHVGPETDAEGAEYVRWALEYCVKNSIDVFVPRYNIEVLTQHIDSFEALGVKVLASDNESIKLLEDKNLTYLKARETGTPVPPWRIASTAVELAEAYESLRAELHDDEQVVLKPTVGVGAEGFRIIDDSPYDIERVFSGSVTKAPFDRVLKAYEMDEAAGKNGPELMVLPFLDDPEISVDCLSDYDGNILKAVPRAKKGKRITEFSTDYPQAVEIVKDFYSNFTLRYLTNTQLRWWRGELVLLETNTRASGGLYATTSTGVNFMWDAIRLAVTGEATPEQPQLGGAYISNPSFTVITNNIAL